MNVSEMPIVRQMKADLLAAMKARQPSTVSVLRSTLAAIDNAGAVEVDASYVPVAGTQDGRPHEVPRKELSEAQVMKLVRAEAEERRSKAEQYEHLGKHDEAAQLRAEFDVLNRYLTTSA